MFHSGWLVGYSVCEWSFYCVENAIFWVPVTVHLNSIRASIDWLRRARGRGLLWLARGSLCFRIVHYLSVTVHFSRGHFAYSQCTGSVSSPTAVLWSTYTFWVFGSALEPYLPTKCLKYCLILLNLVESCRILLNLAESCRILQNFAESCRILQNLQNLKES